MGLAACLTCTIRWRARLHLGAGAGGLAADVDYVCAICKKLDCMLQRAVAIEVHAAIRERVWGDIDHAHNERPLPEFQAA